MVNPFVVRLVQIKILLFKNWRLSVRNWRSTLAQLLLPCLLLALLLVLKAGTSNQVGENGANVRHYSAVPAPTRIPKCQKGPALSSCYTFVYNKPSSTVVQALIAHVLAANNLAATDVLGLNGNASDINLWLYNNNNLTQAAYVFLFDENAASLPAAGQLYTLQINSTLFTGACSSAISQYQFWLCPQVMRDIVLPMQRSINEAIVAVLGTTSPQLPVSLLPFPHPPFVTRGIPAALFLLFAAIFPLVLQLMNLVREKELKLRYALKLIGVKDSAVMVSWTIVNAVVYQLAVLVLIAFGAMCQSTFFLLNDFGTYYFLFMLFAFAMVATGMFLSTLVHSVSPARNIALVYLFFFGLFSGLGSFVYADSAESTVSDGWRYLLALFPPIIMSKGLTDLDTLSSNSAKPGMRWGNIDNNTHLFPMSQVYQWLIIDCCIYGFLAWYFNSVIPDAMGVTRRPWFFCTRSYWCSPRPDMLDGGAVAPKRNQSYSNLRDEPAQPGEDSDVHLERVKVITGQARSAAIEIAELRKEYGSLCKATFTAVDGVSLAIEDNSLFCLLGHNGAGKTTTINTLTGGLDVTGGFARIHGLDVVRDVEAVRALMGVCPQFDVLWDELSAEENISLFAQLKGMRGDRLKQEITHRLEEVGLTAEIKHLPSTFSGGMRRRLSVAMALVGDPRVVFLDEPTTGMDPVSRRAVWDIIAKAKVGRAVVLTTHSMEEADALSDRIGIMAKGKLKCLGTAIHLKHKFGSGYRVAVIASSQALPGVLTEMNKRFPFATKLHATPVAVTLQVASEHTSKLPALFKFLQENHEVKDFQVSLTTLEDVFLRISKEVLGEDDEDAADFQRLDRTGSRQMHVEEPPPPARTNCKQVNALFAKNWHIQKRKRISNCCQICLPTFIILLLVIIQVLVIRQSANVTTDAVIQPPTQPISGLYLGASQQGFPPPVVAPVVVPPSAQFLFSRLQWPTGYGLSNATYIPYGSQSAMEDGLYGFFGTPITRNIPFDIIVNSVDTTTGSLDVTVGFNRTSALAYNSIPAVVDNLFRAMLRAMGYDYQTLASDFPNVQTTTKFDIVALISGILFPLILFFQFPLFVGGVMYDKERKLIEIMKMMGMKMWLYWLVLTIFSFIIYILVIFVLLVFGFIVQFTIFTQNVPASYVILFLLWGIAMIAMAFLFTSFFGKERTATIVSYLLVIASWVVSTVLGSVVDSDPAQAAAYSIYPFFAFARGIDLLATAARNQNGIKMGQIVSSGLGEVYIFLIVETVIMVLITWYVGQVAPVGYGVKRSPLFLCQRHYWRSVCGRPQEDEFVPDVVASTEDDSDIKDERDAVLDPNNRARYAIRLVNLKKAYGAKLAVKGASFGVRKGECLGLLGHNGAGKTTIASMLSGLIVPSSGDAFVMEMSIRREMDRIYPILGVCPQHDLLWETMTAREHLYFYGKLKGLKGRRLKEEVEKTLRQLSLDNVEGKRCGSFSGGMKRRLSIGMSLIGSPRVIFLDEPTTGLDPGHRRDIWRVIAEATGTGASIVLTTHSMEEAEALSDRIAIMAVGKLRALGTSSHLKTKFAAGYTLSMNMLGDHCDPPSIARLADFVLSLAPAAQHMSISLGPSQHFHIPSNGAIKIDEIFASMERSKAALFIADWQLSQTTLQDVFLRISDQVHEEDAASAVLQLDTSATPTTDFEMVPQQARDEWA